ncbi:MAG: hypothetical protein ACRYFS_01455 [Janthinobacterium lividum]
MNNKNNRYMTADGTLLEIGPAVTRMANAASDDIKHHVEAAVVWRDHLLQHLKNSARPGGTGVRLIESIFSDDAEADQDRKMLIAIMQTLIDILPSAEIVLWRPDLLQSAESQADYYADVRVVEANLPRKNEFWCFYGPEVVSRTIGGTHKLFLQVLISGVPMNKRFAALVAFYYPYEGDTILLDTLPLVRFVSSLNVGHSPQDIEAQRLLACLTFRAQPFIDVETLDIQHTRSERRRMEREGRTLPTAQIINLRPKKGEVDEDVNDQPTTRREYQYQFFVSAHLRKPNPRMKEQRPIWVSPYIKGPKDKPLKPPIRNIIVVKR